MFNETLYQKLNDKITSYGVCAARSAAHANYPVERALYETKTFMDGVKQTLYALNEHSTAAALERRTETYELTIRNEYNREEE